MTRNLQVVGIFFLLSGLFGCGGGGENDRRDPSGAGAAQVSEASAVRAEVESRCPDGDSDFCARAYEIIADWTSGEITDEEFVARIADLRESRENSGETGEEPDDGGSDSRPARENPVGTGGQSAGRQEAENPLLSSAYAPGPYAVGVKVNFVKDFSRTFDAWGATYKSAAYRELLARIDASGEPATTATNIYYPSPSSGARVERRENLHPGALWAAASGGRRTSQSYADAPLQEGKFPLVIMIHGLGGGFGTWNRAAEYLASHGYIVVNLAHTSDSASTPVFEDPNSFFAKTVTDDERAAAYRLLVSQPGTTVFGGFYKYLYGLENTTGVSDPSRLVAREGGGLEAGTLMSSLFEQRTEDVGAVIQEMKNLSASEADCREALERTGVQKGICGFFEGAVDDANIGVMGHSLGAITAQSALTFLPDVDTAVAFNNGLPRRWEPYGSFPGQYADGLPHGVPKDFLIVIGSDDYFVHTVFRELHLKWFEAAGGVVSENYPLAIEQVWPTADNPQPIARAAYERAQRAKALIMFRDQSHDAATDYDFNPETPGATKTGRRVPLDRDATGIERYTIDPWVRDSGGDVFLPHQMRNYFITAWFDWQLKGSEAAKTRFLNHPFGRHVRQFLRENI